MFSRSFFTAALLMMCISSSALAQSYYRHPDMEPVFNPSFEDAPDGGFDLGFAQFFDAGVGPLQITKNETSPKLSFITRSWTGSFDEERTLGRQLVRMDGDAGLAIFIPIYPTLGHYLTVSAKSEGTISATYGINYFDSDFRFIKQYSDSIGGPAPGVSRGEGDQLRKYVLPVRTPLNAEWAQIWIDNSPPASDPESGSVTFDFLNVYAEMKSIDGNLRTNPTANLLRNAYFTVPPSFDYKTTGYEFWNASPGSAPGINFASFPSGLLLGQTGKITNMYQELDLGPNQEYGLFLIGSRPNFNLINAPFTRGWVGVDFYDANWRKIGDKVAPLNSDPIFVNEAFVTPPRTAHGFAWFYVEPSFGNDEIVVDSVEVYRRVVAAQSSTKKNAKATTKKPSAAILKSHIGRSSTAPEVVKKLPEKPSVSKPKAQAPATKM